MAKAKRAVIRSHRRYRERKKARVRMKSAWQTTETTTRSKQSKTKEEREQHMYNICDRQGQILPKLTSVQLHWLKPLTTMSLSIWS